MTVAALCLSRDPGCNILRCHAATLWVDGDLAMDAHNIGVAHGTSNGGKTGKDNIIKGLETVCKSGFDSRFWRTTKLQQSLPHYAQTIKHST